MMIEIGPNLLMAVGIGAATYLVCSLFKLIAANTPYHEIHEERITEVENRHVS